MKPCMPLKLFVSILVIFELVPFTYTTATRKVYLPTKVSLREARLQHIDTSSWVGAQYVPSSASNELWWWNFESHIHELHFELAAMKQRLGFTTLRMFLHSMLWKADDRKLLKNMHAFLDIAEQYNIKAGFVFFDDCWNLNSAELDAPCKAVKGRHNGCWMQSPQGWEREQPLEQLQHYVQGVVREFENDPRVLFWEIYNEPRFWDAYSAKLRQEAAKWIQEVDPSQPYISCWDDNTDTEIVDVHRYDGNFNHWLDAVYMNPAKGAVLTEAGARWLQHSSSSLGAPLQVVDWLNALKAEDRPYVPGVFINWEVMVGNSNTRWGWAMPDGSPEPAVPFHGHLFPDGTPVSFTEAAAVKRYTTGEDNFIFLDTFNPPTSHNDHDHHLTLLEHQSYNIPASMDLSNSSMVVETALLPTSSLSIMGLKIEGLAPWPVFIQLDATTNELRIVKQLEPAEVPLHPCPAVTSPGSTGAELSVSEQPGMLAATKGLSEPNPPSKVSHALLSGDQQDAEQPAHAQTETAWRAWQEQVQSDEERIDGDSLNTRQEYAAVMQSIDLGSKHALPQLHRKRVMPEDPVHVDLADCTHRAHVDPRDVPWATIAHFGVLDSTSAAADVDSTSQGHEAADIGEQAGSKGSGAEHDSAVANDGSEDDWLYQHNAEYTSDQHKTEGMLGQVLGRLAAIQARSYGAAPQSTNEDTHEAAGSGLANIVQQPAQEVPHYHQEGVPGQSARDSAATASDSSYEAWISSLSSQDFEDLELADAAFLSELTDGLEELSDTQVEVDQWHPTELDEGRIAELAALASDSYDDTQEIKAFHGRAAEGSLGQMALAGDGELIKRQPAATGRVSRIVVSDTEAVKEFVEPLPRKVLDQMREDALEHARRLRSMDSPAGGLSSSQRSVIESTAALKYMHLRWPYHRNPSLSHRHSQDEQVTVDQVDANVDQAGANVDQVGANVDQVDANVDQVGANADQASASVDQVGANVDQVGASVDQVSVNVDQAGANVDDVDKHDYLEEAFQGDRVEDSSAEAQEGRGIELVANPADSTLQLTHPDQAEIVQQYAGDAQQLEDYNEQAQQFDRLSQENELVGLPLTEFLDDDQLSSTRTTKQLVSRGDKARFASRAQAVKRQDFDKAADVDPLPGLQLVPGVGKPQKGQLVDVDSAASADPAQRIELAQGVEPGTGAYEPEMTDQPNPHGLSEQTTESDLIEEAYQGDWQRPAKLSGYVHNVQASHISREPARLDDIEAGHQLGNDAADDRHGLSAAAGEAGSNWVPDTKSWTTYAAVSAGTPIAEQDHQAVSMDDTIWKLLEGQELEATEQRKAGSANHRNVVVADSGLDVDSHANAEHSVGTRSGLNGEIGVEIEGGSKHERRSGGDRRSLGEFGFVDESGINADRVDERSGLRRLLLSEHSKLAAQAPDAHGQGGYSELGNGDVSEGHDAGGYEGHVARNRLVGGGVSRTLFQDDTEIEGIELDDGNSVDDEGESDGIDFAVLHDRALVHERAISHERALGHERALSGESSGSWAADLEAHKLAGAPPLNDEASSGVELKQEGGRIEAILSMLSRWVQHHCSWFSGVYAKTQDAAYIHSGVTSLQTAAHVVFMPAGPSSANGSGSMSPFGMINLQHGRGSDPDSSSGLGGATTQQPGGKSVSTAAPGEQNWGIKAFTQKINGVGNAGTGGVASAESGYNGPAGFEGRANTAGQEGRPNTAGSASSQGVSHRARRLLALETHGKGPTATKKQSAQQGASMTSYAHNGAREWRCITSLLSSQAYGFSTVLRSLIQSLASITSTGTQTPNPVRRPSFSPATSVASQLKNSAHTSKTGTIDTTAPSVSNTAAQEETLSVNKAFHTSAHRGINQRDPPRDRHAASSVNLHLSSKPDKTAQQAVTGTIGESAKELKNGQGVTNLDAGAAEPCGAGREVLASFDLRKLDNGLVVQAWNMLRVVLEEVEGNPASERDFINLAQASKDHMKQGNVKQGSMNQSNMKQGTIWSGEGGRVDTGDGEGQSAGQVGNQGVAQDQNGDEGQGANAHATGNRPAVVWHRMAHSSAASTGPVGSGNTAVQGSMMEPPARHVRLHVYFNTMWSDAVASDGSVHSVRPRLTLDLPLGPSIPPSSSMPSSTPLSFTASTSSAAGSAPLSPSTASKPQREHSTPNKYPSIVTRRLSAKQSYTQQTGSFQAAPAARAASHNMQPVSEEEDVTEQPGSLHSSSHPHAASHSAQKSTLGFSAAGGSPGIKVSVVSWQGEAWVDYVSVLKPNVLQAVQVMTEGRRKPHDDAVPAS